MSASVDEILKSKNMVVISEYEYNSLLQARKNLEYLKKIDRGIEQMELGIGQEHELIEVD